MFALALAPRNPTKLESTQVAFSRMELHPLLLLAVGIGTVLLLIVVLRTNAFLALITAALLVSVLAPGEPYEKLDRVAVEFGRHAGQIGIAIGLAAIIAQCLMES